MYLSVGLVALSAALFAIDPATVIGQSFDGPERIVVVGLPAAIAAAVAALALERSAPSQPLPFSQNRIDVLGLFVIWMLAGAVFGPNPLLSFAYTTSFACIAIAARIIGRRSLQMLMAALALTLPMYLGLALLSRIAGLNETWFFLNRLTFLSLEANQFARMAGLTAIGGLYLAVEGRELPLRYGGGLVALTGFFLVPIAASRTAAIALLVSVGALIVLRGSKTLILLLASGGSAAIGLVMVSPLGSLVIRGLGRSGESGGAATLTGRTEIWPVVFKEALTHPLVGHGVGTDRSAISKLSFAVGFDIQHAHSIFLHVLFTTGAIGLCLFFWMLWTIVRRPNKQMSRDPWGLGIIVFILIDGISEPVLQNPSASWLGLIAATLLAKEAGYLGDGGDSTRANHHGAASEHKASS